jgi:AcrR family transcriptional regulator
MTITSPRNARSRRTRAAILDATRAIAEGDGGLSLLTMTSVAERAGVSRRAVYMHFPSRASLLAGLFHHVNETDGLSESSRPVHEAVDSEAALDAWAAHLARFHGPLVPITRAIDRARDSDPDAGALWDRIMSDWLAACRGIARRLQREGRLAAPWTTTTATDLLWALMSVDVTDRLLNDRHWSPQRYRTGVAVLLRRTLLTKER